MANKDMRALVRRARRQGWEVTTTGGDHYRFQAPDGHSVYVPATPSGGKRSWLNLRAELRRAGLDI